jgi:polyhydroxyalkanoic acid synthase PhaR subunit
MSTAENQSARRPPDPFELWRQIYETNERAWNAILERTVTNPAFAESSGKLLETFLAAQKTVRDNMRTYLEQINFPTREDIARLGELIVALEEKVDQLDDRLASIESTLRVQTPAAPTSETPETSVKRQATRRPPASRRRASSARATR